MPSNTLFTEESSSLMIWPLSLFRTAFLCVLVLIRFKRRRKLINYWCFVKVKPTCSLSLECLGLFHQTLVSSLKVFWFDDWSSRISVKFSEFKWVFLEKTHQEHTPVGIQEPVSGRQRFPGQPAWALNFLELPPPNFLSISQSKTLFYETNVNH